MTRFGRCGLAVLLGTTWLTASCSSPAGPSQSLAVGAAAQVEDGTLANETTFVVRDAATLRTVWAQIYAGRTAPAPPAVDFTRQMLVIVAMGQQRSSGFSVRIETATRDRREIVVHVTIRRPGDTCVTLPTITGPVAVATLPRSDLPVRFEFTRTTTSCR